MARLLLTGAASGIGRAVAERLVAAGDDVVAWDRSPDAVPGTRHRVVDLADPAAVEAAAAALADDADGPLDALLNVAGVPGTAPAETVLAVNLHGTRRVTEAVLPALTNGGAIVTVASIAALRSDLSDADALGLLDLSPAEAVARHHLDGARAYDASKKALLAWHLRLTPALLPRGIRATTVSPGPTRTPILDDFAATMGDSLTRAEAALHRHAEAGEIADAVVFLARATWINGVDLRVDGGLVALAQAAR